MTLSPAAAISVVIKAACHSPYGGDGYVNIFGGNLFVYLLVFHVQPTGRVTSRRYTLQNLLIIEDETGLVKRIWFLIQLKWQNLQQQKIIIQLSH